MSQGEEKFEDCSEKVPETDPAQANTEEKNQNNQEQEESEVQLSEEEKEEINKKIIDSRKEAGELYKAQKYIEALNMYSLLLKDAKKAKLNDQLVILYCNQGICFNKLNDKEFNKKFLIAVLVVLLILGLLNFASKIDLIKTIF